MLARTRLAHIRHRSQIIGVASRQPAERHGHPVTWLVADRAPAHAQWFGPACRVRVEQDAVAERSVRPLTAQTQGLPAAAGGGTDGSTVKGAVLRSGSFRARRSM